MLIELYNIVTGIVPIVVIGAVISSGIDTLHREQVLMHRSVHTLFFEGTCVEGVVCSDKDISLSQKYKDREHKIRIRKTSSLFGKKNIEAEDAELEDLYYKLEETAEGNTLQ